jgi:hypothetical protein
LLTPTPPQRESQPRQAEPKLPVAMKQERLPEKPKLNLLPLSPERGLLKSTRLVVPRKPLPEPPRTGQP